MGIRIQTIIQHIAYPIMVFGVLCGLVGCMMVAGRTARQGLDELQALDAIGQLANKYPYVDYKQIFSDTYRYELSYGQTYDKILRLLSANGEVVIEKDRAKGFIFTAAKEVSIEQTESTETEKPTKNYYQHSIYITKKSGRITYVTDYPTVLVGDYQEVMIPVARNMLRGAFFGALAAELYPAKRREGIRIARKMSRSKPGIPNGNSQSGVVHIIKQGETLGDVARQYSGKVMNYTLLAEYNDIKDVKKIRVGQKIRIPDSW